MEKASSHLKGCLPPLSPSPPQQPPARGRGRARELGRLPRRALWRPRPAPPVSPRSHSERPTRAATPIGRRPRPSAGAPLAERKGYIVTRRGASELGGRRRRAAPGSRGGGGGSYLPRVHLPRGPSGPPPTPRPRRPDLRPAPAPSPPAARDPAAAPGPRTGGPRARWQTAERSPKPFSMATLATGADSPSRECCGSRGARAARAARRAARRRRRGPGWRPPRRERPRCGRAGPRRGKVSAPASARRRRRLAAALLPCFDHHLISTGNDMENGRKRRLGQTRTPQFRGRSRDSPAASRPGPGENSRGLFGPRPARRGGTRLPKPKERGSVL